MGKTCALIVGLLAASCSPSVGPSTPVPEAPPSEVPEVQLDPYRALVVVDASVVLDARASNAGGGPWSFRWLMEQLAGGEGPAPRFVEAWLRSLRTPSVNGFALEDRRGVEALLGTGPGAWPRTRSGELDLSRAPFRLLAIVNRMDVNSYSNGEGRFVFGFVEPATGEPGRMTVAFEYRLPPLGTPDDRKAWAKRWYEAAQHPFGEAYNRALEELTRGFAARGADPGGVGGSALSQLRMNEAAFGELWELREWQLDDGPQGTFLRPAPLPQTPDQSFNGTEALAEYILQNAEQIRSGTHVLPLSMRAGASPEVGAWAFRRLGTVDESLRHAFARQTCNGCHSSETFSAHGFFHVTPFGTYDVSSTGRDRLSPFMTETEIPRRLAGLAALLGVSLPKAEEPPVPARPRYAITPIPAGEDSAPIALDESGRVLGNSARGPWIWDGQLHLLLPHEANPGRYVAQGFNSRGDVVGYEQLPNGTKKAVLLSGSAVQELQTLGGNYSTANVVDAQGRIAGDSTLPNGEYRSFLFDGSEVRNLGTLGGHETLAFAINSQGHVTGQSQRTDGQLHAFLFDGRAMRALGSLGGRFSRGHAINDRGHVAGLSELVGADHKIHAFYWDGVRMRDLGSLAGLPWTSATGLNNHGVVVGNVYDKPDYNGDEYVTFAFVYRDGQMWNLNELIPPSSPLLRVALSINDRGQILCTDGQSGAPRSHGFLLTPL
jgi:probable HAF family extracellular repeat protein